MTEQRKVLLRQLYSGKKIVLPTVEGSEEVEVSIYEMDESGGYVTISKIFARFGIEDIERLRFSKSQIEKFIFNHQDKLHPDGWATFMLFTNEDEPVNIDKSNIFVYLACSREHGNPVLSFLNRYPFASKRRRRVVVPNIVCLL